ncbi:hypothetical protein WJX81_007628 [Elliptochloris bilobata]|uniref:Ysc84 actin-binding domain-containing protein n=1 Tax=Elliptochloris bilobata TaxID=381761 RepID=A0AAW1QZ40_9CHLO
MATDQNALMQKDEEIVTSLQQLANLPPEQTLILGQKVLQNVQAQAGSAGLGGGLAYVFLQSAYASAGITSLRGQGFVLARANGKWLAPAYVSLSKLGAGLSVGGEVVDSLVVLHRPEDLAKFSKPEFVIKDYVNAGANVPEQGGAHAPSTTVGPPTVFSAAVGLTLKKGAHDLNGAKVKAHTASNEKAYGKEATPEKILSGAVQIPPGLEPLQQALEALSVSHAVA